MSNSPDQPDFDIIDDTDAIAIHQLEYQVNSNEEKLDKRHIRQVMLERKHLFRMRSLMILCAMLCTELGFKMIWPIVASVLHHNILLAIAESIIAIGSMMGTVFLYQRSKEYYRQYQEKILPDPTEAPNFEPLSNGQQLASKLEEIK